MNKSCKSCKIGVSHKCYKCNAVNVHRSKKCDSKGPRCIFNCGHCSNDTTHCCKKCGAWNVHRSADCDSRGPRCYLPKMDLDEKDPKNIVGSYSIVGIILVNDGRILMQRRSQAVKHSGKYGFPGGSLDPTDRSLWSGAIRELHEESGYDLSRDSSAEYIGYITKGQAIDFVIKTNLSKWDNRGSHKYEVDTCYIGIDACFGHCWVSNQELKKINKYNCIVTSFFKDVKKMLDQKI